LTAFFHPTFPAHPSSLRRTSCIQPETLTKHAIPITLNSSLYSNSTLNGECTSTPDYEFYNNSYLDDKMSNPISRVWTAFNPPKVAKRDDAIKIGILGAASIG
jgi:hypothetical protein